MDAREALERRIDELCRENERLRQDSNALHGVVRCRDCESYRERINGCVEFGRMEYEEYAIVEPDGFCAWGKRREA